MAILQPYTTGTVSVTNASKTVTGSSTAWKTAGFQAGDQLAVLGVPAQTIATVDSETQITLAQNYSGTTGSGKTYELRYVNSGDRANAALQEIAGLLNSGNIDAIAGVTSAADKLPYFTGPGTADVTAFPTSARSLLGLTAAADKLPYFSGTTAAALTPLTAMGRALIGLTGANGQIPVMTGAGTAAARNIVGTVSQASGVPTGAIVETSSNANGLYTRFADGTQICAKSSIGLTYNNGYNLETTWTTPAAFVGTIYATAVLTGGGAGDSSNNARQGLFYAKGSSGSAVTIGVATKGVLFVSGDVANVNSFAFGRWY